MAILSIVQHVLLTLVRTLDSDLSGEWHHSAVKQPGLDCFCYFFIKGSENQNGYFVASQDRALRSHLQKIPGNILYVVSFLFLNN